MFKMQLLVKLFCTVCKLQLSLCRDMVDTCCQFTSQRVGDAEQCEGCVWNVPHSQLTPVCDHPPGGDESLQFYWLQWWGMLPGLEGSGCNRQLPAGGRGRVTGCVCSVQWQGRRGPLLKKYPNLFVPEHSVSWGTSPCGEDVVALSMKPAPLPYMGHFKVCFYPYTAISNPSFGKQIASAAAVEGLDDPAMLSSLRAAINWRSTKSQSHRGGHIPLLCSSRRKMQSREQSHPCDAVIMMEC